MIGSYFYELFNWLNKWGLQPVSPHAFIMLFLHDVWFYHVSQLLVLQKTWSWCWFCSCSDFLVLQKTWSWSLEVPASSWHLGCKVSNGYLRFVRYSFVLFRPSLGLESLGASLAHVTRPHDWSKKVSDAHKKLKPPEEKKETSGRKINMVCIDKA